MLSLDERIDLLERDLTATPMRISPHSDLPFAILRYDPGDEWEMRRRARQLASRLEQTGKTVQMISLADLLWHAIETTEGMEAIVSVERDYDFRYAQDAVTTILSDPELCPLTDLLAERMRPLDPRRHVVFLTRAAAMAPNIYQMSRMLEEMQGKTDVPAILFYPGTLEGDFGLRFMDLQQHEAMGNYRVKIYG